MVFKFRMHVGTILAVAALCAFGTSDARAQAQPGISQAEAFEAVLANPADPDALLTYARAAVADRDYEAAISTLERLLDFEPNLAAARYELAVAYFALGSYDLAQFHFMLLQQNPAGLDAARASQIPGYLDRIDQAGAGQSFRGTASLGAAVSDGDPVLSLGVDLDWSIDLGGANNNSWETDFLARRFEGQDAISSARYLIRTGPQFSVDGLAFGLRLRPYLGLESVQDDDGDDYVSTQFGVQYLNAHSGDWSSFADLSFGQLDGSGTLSDADLWSATVGASFTPTRVSRVRLSLRASERDADVAADSRDRRGARVDYAHAGTGIFGDPDRRWEAGGFVQYDQLEFDATGREDDLTAFGLSLRTFVTDTAFVDLSASATRRDSSDDANDGTTPVVSVQFGMEF